ncbi:DUF1638 domain-containing protein [Geomonas sp. Red32]|uniref:DUF1638 domain-containing protein n=1 Tax=Geomonas sp. Red32 TaxID=2912856 RepID=UPI00202CC894|nr:DUF1638 domain-containing protein [Geomonas sp. Red32]MCM0083815.1 DUF1638 domain-containing protein [Geomonas sp. Red32]
MADTIDLLVCENYLEEARRVVASDPLFDGVTVRSFPSRCGRPPLSLEDASQCLSGGTEADIIGDSCLALLRDAPGSGTGCRLHIATPCFEMFAGRGEVERAIREGAYLLTPGWLAHWRERIASWRFTREELHAFLLETTSKLILLDTGVCAESSARLQEFAEYAGFPHAVVDVGLDHFSRLLTVIVLKRRLAQQQLKGEETVAKLRHQCSDYAMALDLLGRFNCTQDEEETIRLVLGTFDMLLAPKELSYVSFEEGKALRTHSLAAGSGTPDEATVRRLADLAGNHCWSDPGGSLFRVALDDETLGMVVVEGITFPEYRQHYVDMALTVLLPICALSINNARNYERLKRSEQALLALTIDLDQRVKERTAELEKNNEQLTLINRFLVNRELRMAELKEKIRKLEEGGGKAP